MNELMLRRRAMFATSETKPSFDFVIDTTANGVQPTDKTYNLPLSPGSTSRNYDMIVDWGDGTTEPIPSNYSLAVAKSHAYAVRGTYTIKIISESGKTPDVSFYFHNNGNSNQYKLVKILTPLLLLTNNGVSLRTDVGNMCYSSRNLSSVPFDLFKNNTQITSITGIFVETGLSKAPDLSMLKSCINFSRTFLNCASLKIDPNIFCDDSDPTARAERFAGKTVNFSDFINRSPNASSYGGQAPQLWNYAGTFTSTAAFNGNNINSLSNYNDIPESWGGRSISVVVETSANQIIQAGDSFNPSSISAKRVLRVGDLSEDLDGGGSSIDFSGRNYLTKPNRNTWVVDGNWMIDEYKCSYENMPAYYALRTNLVPAKNGDVFFFSMNVVSFQKLIFEMTYHKNGVQLGYNAQFQVHTTGLFEYKADINFDKDFDSIRITFFSDIQTNGRTEVSNFILSNSATAWQPAPEDATLTLNGAAYQPNTAIQIATDPKDNYVFETEWNGKKDSKTIQLIKS